jgi:hypothetical protein
MPYEDSHVKEVSYLMVSAYESNSTYREAIDEVSKQLPDVWKPLFDDVFLFAMWQSIDACIDVQLGSES